MKHNLLKSVILSVILFMGVSNVWGKTVWIDVSNAPDGYTNSMFVHYWGGSSNSFVSTSDYGTVNGYKIYKAEIPDDATNWQVCRKGDNGNYYNYQKDLTYSDHNKYSVTGWDNSGTGTKVIGMVKGGHIYFNNIDTKWNTTYLQFVIGHTTFSRTYAVENIENTQLYYLNLTSQNNHEWPDATYYGFIATESDWFYDDNWGSQRLSEAKSYTAPYTSDYNLDAGSVYYCKTNSTSNNSPFNINYESALTNLNHTQTIKYALSEYGGTPAIMNSGTTPAKITMSSYKFESGTYNAVSAESATMNAKESTFSKTFTAAQTATTTLIVSEIVAGYKFDGWYKEGGELLTKETTCTYSPTASETIHARFIEVCKITLDPFPYGEYGVRIDGMEFLCHPSEKRTTEVQKGSVVEIIDRQPTHEFWDFNPKYACSVVVEPQGEGNQEIKSNTYTIQKDVNFRPNYGIKQTYRVYLHLPNTKIPNTNVTFVDKWNSINSNYKNFIYAEDYLSKGQLEVNGIKKGQLIYMTKEENLSSLGQGEYWYIDIPAGYHTFRFERKEDRIGVATGLGARSAYFKNFVMPFTDGTCYTLNSYDGNVTFTGTWGEPPKRTVTLGYCEFGEYSVMCNGNIYTSTPNQNVSFEALYGSEITFVEGTPLQDIYKGGWMLREPNKTRLDATQPYIVKGNITLDDNFVTRNERVFYFAVPTTKNSDTQWDNAVDKWNKPNAEYYIWTNDDVGSFDMLGDKCHGHPMQSYGTKNGYKYYKFTLPAERNQFRFEHKVPLSDTTINNSNPTLARTHYLQFQVPTTEKNCYYLTGEYTTSNGTDYYNGYWDILPIDDDQYRLLYVEQVVEKDKENNTVLTRKKAHPSDVIKKGVALDTVSLHVYRERSYQGIKRYDEEGPDNNKQHDYYTTKASNAGVILQKTVGGKWVDVSHHMVFGPLEAVPEVALLPGRKNAASSNSTDYDYLYYDDGIENIKNDTHADKGNGVWNFVVKKDNYGEFYIALDETHRYTGEYYIRTVAAEGGWENYNKVENQMTRSNISKKNSNFSHYFCKWIGQAGTDVQFTVANDYGCAISDTLMSDRTDLWEQRLSESKKMVTALTIPAPANIRFAWNEKTNFIHRAYLSGSTNVSDRFLVLEGDANIFDAVDGTPLKAGENTGSDPRFGLNDNEEIFKDNNNWLYYADVQMKPMAPVTVTAKYANKVQYFVGKETKDTIMLRGSGDKKYLIRMLYDFKTNELISAYVPYNNASNQVDVITTNLMLIRQDNGETKQLSFASTDMTERVDRRSYGVIEFTKERLINDQSLNPYERSLYWISFPFDVNLQDALSFGTYGTHWIIQEYDGAQRAKDGLWLDSDTFWKYHWDQNITLKANQGYVVALAIEKIKTDGLFDISAGNPIGIYFPSVDYVTNEIINQTKVTTTVPAHKCEINRGTPKGDRRIKDSHWNVIGVPSYANTGANFQGESVTTINDGYVYEWLGEPDQYRVIQARNYNFKSLYAYMVQYTGELKWTTIVQEKGMFSLSARKETDEQEKAHYLTLELQQNGQKQDYTFIELQEENVTTAFDFNYDLCKITNKGANIYSLIATDTYPVEVAANVLPIEETIIPLGIKLDAAGEYTFAMPEGTDGIVVELIDYETNTRTNMLLDEYTINLGKGTFENRFALHVKPDKTVTSVEDINTNSDGVRKFIIDGVLYMQKDGVLYDAQGRCVR